MVQHLVGAGVVLVTPRDKYDKYNNYNNYNNYKYYTIFIEEGRYQGRVGTFKEEELIPTESKITSEQIKCLMSILGLL